MVRVMEDSVWKRAVAESAGTAGLVFAGPGAIIIDELSAGEVTHLGIGLTFGMIVAVMVYAIGHISGAHINPAVSLVGNMGATVPAGSAWQSLGLEIALTFILMFVIMAVATDVRAVGQTAAIAIGTTVGLGAIFAGPISGASMNPARSFGPALVGWVWSSHWIYWVGPLVEAMTGALLYRWLRGTRNASGEMLLPR